MLASSGRIKADPGDYSSEPKLDGWRAVVTVAEGRTVVRTRHGYDISDRATELAQLSDHLAGRSVVLDGELVAYKGLPHNFYKLGGRIASKRPTAKSRRVPLTFVAFDVLWLDGEDVTARTYLDRRALLNGLAVRGPAWTTAPAYDSGPELFMACEELGLEGVVAKRLDGRYRPGERSTDWVKWKTRAWKVEHGQWRHRER